jgi:hypothetical protein
MQQIQLVRISETLLKGCLGLLASGREGKGVAWESAAYHLVLTFSGQVFMTGSQPR